MSGFKTGDDATWTILQGRLLATYLEPILSETGFHVGLTGSTLYRGESKKDLDFIIYPHCVSPKEIPNFDKASAALKRAGLERVLPADEVEATRRTLGSFDTKRVEIWTWQGKRVDFFYLS